MSEPQQSDVDRLLAAPEDVERAPLAHVPGLLARLASTQLQLAGLQAALLARLQTASPRRDADDRLLDMETVAQVLDVPIAHAREMGRRHELPIVRVGRYVKVRESSLQTWLRQREEVGPASASVYHPRRKRAAVARVVPLSHSEVR
jgi:excisionase family DNA binding protein